MSNLDLAVLKKEVSTNEVSFENTNRMVRETNHSSATESDAKNYEMDVLSQFRANLTQVDALTRKLKYVLGEVQYLIKNRY